MSALPEIDELKVAKRELDKLRQQVLTGNNREAHLEILAEALRDERDALANEIAELKAEKPAEDATV
jgi:hypothetical protein